MQTNEIFLLGLSAAVLLTLPFLVKRLKTLSKKVEKADVLYYRNTLQGLSCRIKEIKCLSQINNIREDLFDLYYEVAEHSTIKKRLESYFLDAEYILIEKEILLKSEEKEALLYQTA